MCNINQTGFASFSIIMILPTQHFTKKQPNSPKKQIHKKNLQGLHANPWLMLLRWIILTSRCAHYTPDNARFSPSRTLMHQHCGLTHQRCRSRQKRHGIEGYRSPSAKWTTVYSSKGFSIKYLSPINVNILSCLPSSFASIGIHITWVVHNDCLISMLGMSAQWPDLSLYRTQVESAIQVIF